MATVYSRPMKSGGVRWYTKLQQPDGKWKGVPLKAARNEPQAWKLAVEMEAHNVRLLHGLEGGTMFAGTFGELCTWAWDVHFKHLRGTQSDASRLEYHGGAVIRTAKATTRRGAKRAADGWRSPLGPMPARQLTRQVLERYFDELAQKTTVRGTLMSPSSINRVRAVFSKVFELAKDRGHWAGDNPAELTKTRKQRHTEFRILELHEIPRILEALPDHWRGCFAMGLLSGLRKGELFGLMKSDVDLERRRLLVRRSHGHDRTKGGDGKAEPVPIHPDLMPFVVEAMTSPGAYLFPGHDGKRRSERTKVERILRAAMVRAGIVESYDHKCRRKGCGHVESHADDAVRECPRCDMKLWPVGRPRHIRFHDTRHTLASQALMAGATMHAVQGILRHKDPRTTMKHYSHLAPDYLADELSMMTIPGMASRSAPETTRDAGGESVEHQAPRRINSRRSGTSHGAPMVRGDRVSVIGGSSGSRSGRKQGGLSVEPRGIEPLTYALRKPHGGAPQTVTDYHHAGSAAFSGGTDSTGSHAQSPVLTSHGASMVRGTSGAHHGAALRITPGSFAAPLLEWSGDDPPGRPLMLTVKQVAERLQVSTGCVYRQVEIGALGHCRVGNAIRVTEADLAAYLARSAGGGGPR